jgi:excisionase family DNA binding protein
MQAAVLLKCHSKTLRLTAIGRKIPSKRVGSHWRFYRPKLEAWLKEDS